MTTRDQVRHSITRTLLRWMLLFGLAMGLVFPPFAYALLEEPRALGVTFWMACIAAGLIVGGANYLLFHVVVTRYVRRVAGAMSRVVERVERYHSDAGACGDECLLTVTSDDAFGEIEQQFNDMAHSVTHRVALDAEIQSILTRLTDGMDVESVAETLLDCSLSASGGRAGLLYVDTGHHYLLVARRAVDQTADLPRVIDDSHGLAAETLHSGRMCVIRTQDGEFDWLSVGTGIGRLRPSSLVLLPLRTDQRTVGLAVLAGDVRDDRSIRRPLLAAIGERGGAHLENAVLHGKLKALAAVDELTGLLNRRFGAKRLEEEFSQAMRHGLPLSVILLDIDHFKRFNDDFGHDAGDAVLRQVAETMEGAARSGDVICRYGGEEFLIIAPRTGDRDAATFAHRVRRLIQSTVVSHRDLQLSVTASFGIASWPVLAASAAPDLVTAADAALYGAKHRGRNCVCVANQGAVELAQDTRREEPAEGRADRTSYSAA